MLEPGTPTPAGANASPPVSSGPLGDDAAPRRAPAAGWCPAGTAPGRRARPSPRRRSAQSPAQRHDGDERGDQAADASTSWAGRRAAARPRRPRPGRRARRRRARSAPASSVAVLDRRASDRTRPASRRCSPVGLLRRPARRRPARGRCSPTCCMVRSTAGLMTSSTRLREEAERDDHRDDRRHDPRPHGRCRSGSRPCARLGSAGHGALVHQQDVERGQHDAEVAMTAATG